MKKKIKVFEVGKYPQGEFSLDKVKSIFGGISDPIKGIFSHTSKWLSQEKEPVGVGEFDNFSIEGDSVYADVNFNEKGTKYFNDGILKGVSVEINGNRLSKIAVLPVGITPAVSGAEFQEEFEGITIEFEEGVLDIELLMSMLDGIDLTTLEDDVLSRLQTKIYELGDQSYMVKKLTEEGYKVQKEFSKEELEEMAKAINFTLVEFQEPVIKTTEEIKAEARAEVQAEFAREKKLSDVKESMKKKVLPVMIPIIEFAAEKALDETDKIIEFSATEKLSVIDKIEGTLKAMPELGIFKEFHKELGDEPEESVISKSFNETKKMYGGK